MVKVPLVIHGATGFPDDAIRRVIELGVAKFNVGTVLKRAYWLGLRDALTRVRDDANPQHVVGSRKESDIFVHARTQMCSEVERLIALYRRTN